MKRIIRLEVADGGGTKVVLADGREEPLHRGDTLYTEDDEKVAEVLSPPAAGESLLVLDRKARWYI
jgi:urease accessory protein UreE